MKSDKICQYTINPHTRNYTWIGTPHCKCIMAIALDTSLDIIELSKLQHTGKLTKAQYYAIRNFDTGYGDEQDLIVLEKLAKRVKVELLRVV